MSGLLGVESVPAEHLDEFVRRHSTVIQRFDHRTQDSGNVSWLVEVERRRLFVKTAGAPHGADAGGPTPYLDHAGRVALLRNAVALAHSCTHPALPRLLHVLESPSGPVLVYEAASGELVHVPRELRGDPGSAYQRFAHLPAERLLGVFDILVDLHVRLTAVGWIAGDLYDGCLIVDLASGSLAVIDLDTYRRGPSVNEMGRMFGSSRFMAPEEHRLGAVIDERTTVYTLGRMVWHFGTRLTEAARDFCGSTDVAEVVLSACRDSPAQRYATVEEFGRAWTAARRRGVQREAMPPYRRPDRRR